LSKQLTLVVRTAAARREEQGFSRFDPGPSSLHPRLVYECIGVKPTHSSAPIPTSQARIDADGWGVRMEENPTTIAEEISIERCRELLGDEAERLSDEDVARHRRHAETFARVLIELFLEQRSRVH